MQAFISNINKPEILKALALGIFSGAVLGTVLYKVCYLLAGM